MDAIQESLNEMMKLFGERMDSFEERQASKPSSSGSDNLALEFTKFKSFVSASLRALQSQIEVLAKQVDQQETRGRRKFLMLHGLREEPKENTFEEVVKVLVNRFKLTSFSAKDLSQCHRMGRIENSNRPRPILFKLRDEAIRGKIWASKTALKGSGITLSEFLTKTRHDVFMAARSQFGANKCWTREGLVLVIGPDGARHRVCCPADLAMVAHIETSKSPAPKEASKAKVVVPPKVRRAATKK